MLAAGSNGRLPPYALPDLANLGTSWVYPITKYMSELNINYRGGAINAQYTGRESIIVSLKRCIIYCFFFIFQVMF